ncbi:hypothetical protein BCR33DRAFT_713314 [Rhizoclosmatium globosum]|uniref:Uncharacterized protein n=1 Tax=Rhizoclosmatium globosum TaxID=329046 RepID=A0A1Y2CU96_9FUNG|nr:hypothetical protein BCR33DRAFT_713314 [Rhizoclosmatium globosum]|eukprot:ORY50537.1 hypothetical protein BCR33DRAFT_713314 [Rhizoclosmatium globosum]
MDSQPQPDSSTDQATNGTQDAPSQPPSNTISNAAPFSAGSLANLNYRTQSRMKSKTARNGPSTGTAYFPSRQASAYTGDQIQQTIRNLSVRDVPVHLFMNMDPVSARPSATSARSRSSMGIAGSSAANFNDIVSKVNSSYDIQKLAPEKNGSLVEKLENAGSDNEEEECEEEEERGEEGTPVVAGDGGGRRQTLMGALFGGGSDGRASLARGSVVGGVSAKQLNRNQVAPAVDLEAQKEESGDHDASNSGSLEYVPPPVYVTTEKKSGSFMRRVSNAIEALIPIPLFSGGGTKESDASAVANKSRNDMSVRSLKRTQTLHQVFEEEEEENDTFDIREEENLEEFKELVNRRRSSNMNLPPPDSANAANIHIHVANSEIVDQDEDLPVAPTIIETKRGSLTVPGKKPLLPQLHTAHSQPSFTFSAKPLQNKSKPIFIGGMIGMPIKSSQSLRSSVSRAPTINEAKPTLEAPAEALSPPTIPSPRASTAHRRTNTMLDLPSTSLTRGLSIRSATSSMGRSSVGTRSRSRSVSHIVIPTAPSPVALALASARPTGSSITNLSPNPGSPPPQTRKSDSFIIPEQTDGKSESALRYIQAFSILRGDAIKSDLREKRKLERDLVSGDAALAASVAAHAGAVTSLDTFGKVVKMAADMKQVGMDPSLAAELDKDTLTMVLKLKKWARSRQKPQSKFEGYLRGVNAQVETELPVGLEVDLIEDVLPVVSLYRKMYEAQLGVGHNFAVNAAKYQSKLEERVRKEKCWNYDGSQGQGEGDGMAVSSVLNMF